MRYQIEQVRALAAADFRRRLGVKPETFEAMLAVLVAREAAKRKRGRPPDLSLEEPLLLALQFWREDRRGRAGVEHGHRRCHRASRGASQKKQRACYSGKKKRYTLKREGADDATAYALTCSSASTAGRRPRTSS